MLHRIIALALLRATPAFAQSPAPTTLGENPDVAAATRLFSAGLEHPHRGVVR